MFLVSSVILITALLWAIRPEEYYITALNIMNLYVYNIFGVRFDPRIGGTFEISGALMLMVVRMGNATKYFDGNTENILDCIFFIPGIITGPTKNSLKKIE